MAPRPLPAPQLSTGLHAAQHGLLRLAEELRTLRVAVEADPADPVPPARSPSSTSHSADPHATSARAPAAANGTSPGAAAAPPALATGSESLPAGSGSAGTAAAGSLRGLPACHVRRTQATAGPLLAARVVAHSAVAGERAPLLRFHAALEAVFAPATAAVAGLAGSAAVAGIASGGGADVSGLAVAQGPARALHPLARMVASAASAPTCLQLTGRANATSGGPQRPPALAHSRGEAAAAAPLGHVVLELQPPVPDSQLHALSLRYPAFGTWDTASALHSVGLTLLEGPAGHGTARGGSDVRGAALRAREVELPPLKSLECQHVLLQPLLAAAKPKATSGGNGAAHDQAGEARGELLLVHGLVLRVLRNAGNASYSCVPRVLLHSRPVDA
jgi:hypothetical protein